MFEMTSVVGIWLDRGLSVELIRYSDKLQRRCEILLPFGANFVPYCYISIYCHRKYAIFTFYFFLNIFSMVYLKFAFSSYTSTPTHIEAICDHFPSAISNNTHLRLKHHYYRLSRIK